MHLLEGRGGVHLDLDHALVTADAMGFVEIVKVLLLAGADVHAEEEEGVVCGDGVWGRVGYCGVVGSWDR